MSPGRRKLVADESLLSFDEYMTQDTAISESLILALILLGTPE